MTCAICKRVGSLEVLTTYKSLWFWCNACGGLSRQQRGRYPLEPLSRALSPLLGAFDKGRKGLEVLGRKKQGADFYRYYEDYINRGDRGKWAGEYARLASQLRTLGIDLPGRRLLDISGEPGFFAKDAEANGMREPVVTAYADNVARALQRLGLESLEYDFNKHSLASAVGGRRFDLVCARWSIGFCEDIDAFFREAYSMLDPGGIFVVSYSPSSRAVCSRWMFDDYTYLRAYTGPWVRLAGVQAGFSILGAFDEGSFQFNHNLPLVMRLLINAYRWLLEPKLRRGGPYHRLQHNETLVFFKR